MTGPAGSNSKTEVIQVYKRGRPKANFTASPNRGPAPLEVQFTNLSTGWITGWAWDFGDGSTSAAQSPLHTYNNPGKYKATLTAIGPGGFRSKRVTIKVMP